jgi:hypothetical protein
VKCQRLDINQIDLENDHEWHTEDENTEYKSLQIIVKHGRLLVGTLLHPELVNMNSRATFVFLELLKVSNVQLMPFVKKKALQALFQPGPTDKKVNIIFIEVNVQGLESDFETIGALLSDHNFYLQDPFYHDRAILYRNPHVMIFDLPDEQLWLHELSMDLLSPGRAKENNDWNMVLDDLPQNHNLNANAIQVNADVVTREIMPCVATCIDCKHS